MAASEQVQGFRHDVFHCRAVAYCLCVYFNWPVFTYFPVTGRFYWGLQGVQSGTGPNMLWYGWTVTTILIAGALGIIAMMLPSA